MITFLCVGPCVSIQQNDSHSIIMLWHNFVYTWYNNPC